MRKKLALFSAAALLVMSGCNSRQENASAVTSADTAVTTVSTSAGTTAQTTTSTTATTIETTTATAQTTVSTTAETAATTLQTTAATTAGTTKTTTAVTTAATTVQTTVVTDATTTQTTTAATDRTTTQTTAAATAKTTTSTTPPESEPEEADPYKIAAEERRKLLPEIDVPVYSHSFAGDYVLLTVKPEKIYWNYLTDFQPVEGEPFTMLFPAVFYDVFKESDSVLLNFPYYNYTEYGDWEGLEGVTADFMYLQYTPTGYEWKAGLLYPIKDGILTELDCIDRVDKYFAHDWYVGYDYFDVLMDDEEGEGFPDEFYYGLTVDEVDRFMTEKHKECAESQKRADEEKEAGLVECVLFSLGHDFMLCGAEMRLTLVE